MTQEDKTMKTKKEEAQLAFELWERMAQLESILWNRYDKEFLDMIMDEEDKTMMDNSSIDDTDTFPS